MKSAPSEDFDQYDPMILGLPTSFAQPSADGNVPVRPRHTKPREKFVQIPLEHVPLLVSLKSVAAFAVYCVLYQTWFANSNRWNPIRLNMTALCDWGLDRHTIHRAVKRLQQKGLVYVDQWPGRSPLVTLRWKDVNKKTFGH